MLVLSSFILSFLSASVACAGLADSSLENHVNSLSLDFSFNPIKEAYWTGLPHHRRTPFAISPDGKSAYLAYLDSSDTDVHVQQLDPSTFAAVGTVTTVTGGKEAGGLIAHDDGFALLTNEALPSGTANAPADSTPVAVLYRYTDGKQSWKTFLEGPGVHADFGLTASPDMNGDLVFSEATGMYGAYFVVTAYTGDASGHYGDSVQYVSENGTLETITGASSSFGCSHNTGIAFEAADSVPFASMCAEDQGAIWLNTKTQYMDGVKVSNENTTNGASGEPFGGMGGSYSGLARFQGKDSYIATWVSRGAKDLSLNDWLGSPYTHSINRTNNRNVAIAQFSDKDTLVGDQASSTVGAANGDSQINWITTGTADCNNAHVATFDGANALVTWEEISDPQCDFIAMGCQGKFIGSKFQLVNNGAKVGDALVSTDTYVAGDMVTFPDGKICWPYVSMTWDLSAAVPYGGSTTTTKQMSFACMRNGVGSGNSTSNSTTSTSSAALISSSAPVTSAAAQSSARASSAKVADVSSSAPAVSSIQAAVSSALISSASAAGSIPVSTSVAAIQQTSVVDSSIILASSVAAEQPVPSSATQGGANTVTQDVYTTTTSIVYVTLSDGAGAPTLTSLVPTTFATAIAPSASAESVLIPSSAIPSELLTSTVPTAVPTATGVPKGLKPLPAGTSFKDILDWINYYFAQYFGQRGP